MNDTDSPWPSSSDISAANSYTITDTSTADRRPDTDDAPVGLE